MKYLILWTYYYWNGNEESGNFFLIILKLKKCISMQLRNYLTCYVSDRYKTQQVCDKAILENGGTLKSVPDCYKNQEMCNKAVDDYPHALEFGLECYKTQKMCDKAVSTYPSTIKFVPECFMTQEMCGKAFNRCFFLYFILFLVGIKLKKCVTDLFLKIFF